MSRTIEDVNGMRSISTEIPETERPSATFTCADEEAAQAMVVDMEDLGFEAVVQPYTPDPRDEGIDIPEGVYDVVVTDPSEDLAEANVRIVILGRMVYGAQAQDMTLAHGALGWLQATVAGHPRRDTTMALFLAAPS